MNVQLFIVILRWRSPKLIIPDEQSLISTLAVFLPNTTVEARIDQLGRLVQNYCPSHHIDFYIFLLAVLCIICSAIFTFVARSLNISMWCPLLLLLVPTALSFWTNEEQRTHTTTKTQFESRLKKTLYEFNTHDSTHHINWSLERVPIEQAPTTRSAARFCLMIHITELDPELGDTIRATTEELPTYQEVATNRLSIPPSPSTPPPSYELTMIRPPEPIVTAYHR